MKRLFSLALAAGLALATVAGPARACCENFWSCVGAVATLGVSCKVEQIVQAIDGIKKLLAAVSQTRAAFMKNSDDGVKQVKDDVRSAGDQMKDDARKGLEDIKQAMSETELVTRKQTMKLSARAPGAPAGAMALAPGSASAAPGAGAAGAQASQAGAAPSLASAGGSNALAPAGGAAAGAGRMPYDPPADPARLAEDLKRALARVQATHTGAATKHEPNVRDAATRAGGEVLKQEPDARTIVQKDLFDPLDAIKGQLEHILAQIANPFDFSSVGAYVDQQVKLLQSRAPGTMDMMQKKLASLAGDRLKDGERSLGDVKKGAGDAQKIADLSKKAAESGKQSDLKKLEAYIGAPPNSAGFAQGTVTGLGAATGPSSRSIASAAFQKSAAKAGAAGAQGKTLSSNLASKWNATRPLLQLAPVAVTPAMEKRVSDDLSKMFAGKAPADAIRTQGDLLAQAKVRFANDPKTLAAVETYLRQKTAPLVAAPSAPIRR